MGSMKSFFSKKSSKKHLAEDDDDEDFSHSEPSSPVKSPAKSPSKSGSQKSQKPARPDSPSARESKPRSSRNIARQATDPGSSSPRKKKIDLDTHPLNLPPEERKRFSALSAMSNRDSMDIDKEPAANGTPSSPPPQPQHPDSFSKTAANGASPMHIDSDVPVPPPHRSSPSSPVPSPEEEAEAYKAAGNKLFKEKEYKRAIEEYSKGTLPLEDFKAQGLSYDSF